LILNFLLSLQLPLNLISAIVSDPYEHLLTKAIRLLLYPVKTFNC